MKFHVFYGAEPKLTNAHARDFSHGGYVCMSIMETPKGKPVFISKSKHGAVPAWKVEFGASCCVFATEKEAMDFCKRFRPLPE